MWVANVAIPFIDARRSDAKGRARGWRETISHRDTEARREEEFLTQSRKGFESLCFKFWRNIEATLWKYETYSVGFQIF